MSIGKPWTRLTFEHEGGISLEKERIAHQLLLTMKILFF